MDPSNNSIPTQNPVPGAAPVPPVTPGVPVSQVNSSSPVPPTAPVTSVPPVAPIVTPENRGEDVARSMGQSVGVVDATEKSQPVNNVVGNGFATPVSPVARPTNIDGIKSVPMENYNDASSVGTESVPAEPISGSNAMDGQGIDEVANTNPFATSGNTPNVSFADPAVQPETGDTANVTQSAVMGSKKKSNKAVLIALSVIAFVVAAVLCVVLVMMLNEWGPFSSGNPSSSSSSAPANDSSNNNNSNSDGGNSSSDGNSSDGTGENNSGNGAVVNPGEDTIVCTMTQNNTSEDGIVYTSTITMTLYFANNNFARVSVRGESVSEGSSTPTVTTMDMSAKEMLEMSGIDWDQAGFRPNEDGSVAATKDQVLSAINSSSNGGMTCISPDSM